MDHVKETKTDKQAPAATSTAASSSASCSSSSSASSPAAAQHDQDGSHDIALPAVPSPSSTQYPIDTEPAITEARPEAADATDSSKAMDVDEQQPQQAQQPPAEAQTVTATDSDSAAASTDPATMTDDLASSLSSTSLTSPLPASATAAALTAALSSSDCSSDLVPSSSSTSSSTAELATACLDPDEQRIQASLKAMHGDVKKGEASVRAMLKMLQNLQKAPTKPDYRKMRKDNIVVKKNIVEVTGALALLELVGYRTVELKGHPYIAIDEAAGINTAILEKAIKLLLQYQERQAAEESKPASVTSGTRVRCAGGCGYWGDSSQESLCSVCHKAKYLGASAAKAMTGIGLAGAEANKCIKHCGLYGSDKFGGLCSQCFNKEKAKTSVPVKKSGRQRWLGVRRQLHGVYLFSLGKQEEQANKGRCFVCSKRLPVPIECRCRRTFCSSHRFPLDHQCSYDAQSQQKIRLRRQLIHMQTSKMDKI